MSETNLHGSENLTRDEMMAALFGQLVIQQSNMAMMLLGKVAHPETGKIIKDIQAASFFIDQLEMLEVKTKGNLSKEEAGLLKQSLLSLRLAFVEAVEGKDREPGSAGGATSASAPAPAPAEAEKKPAAASSEEDEHRKKFSKKY